MKKCTGSLLLGVAVGIILAPKIQINVVHSNKHVSINSNRKSQPFLQNNIQSISHHEK
jgi:hypothetical protein